MKILLTVLRTVAVLFIVYVALVLYIQMRKENILSFARQEVELTQEGDTLVVKGLGLGCARASEFADSLSNESVPHKLILVEPIYDAEDYLHKRYGIFYPKF